jgi:hypothetical protein
VDAWVWRGARNWTRGNFLAAHVCRQLRLTPLGESISPSMVLNTRADLCGLDRWRLTQGHIASAGLVGSMTCNIGSVADGKKRLSEDDLRALHALCDIGEVWQGR